MTISFRGYGVQFIASGDAHLCACVLSGVFCITRFVKLIACCYAKAALSANVLTAPLFSLTSFASY